MGGHYYAYLKSTRNGQWYNFNDSKISAVTIEEVESSFGQDEGRSSSAAALATAYMLIYRIKAPGAAEYDPSSDPRPAFEVPADVLAEIEEENQKFFQEKKEWQLKLETLHIQLIFGDERQTYLFPVHRLKTMRETIPIGLDKIIQTHAELAKVSLDNIRFRKFNKSTNVAGTVFGPKDLDKTLADLQIIDGQMLLVELKKDGEEWPEDEEDSQAHTLGAKIIRYNWDLKTFDEPLPFHVPRTSFASLGSFQAFFQELFGLDASQFRVSRLHTADMSIQEVLTVEDLIDGSGLPLTISQEAQLFYYEVNSLHEGPTGVAMQFETDKNTIEIKYNLLNMAVADQFLEIDQRLPLRSLKQRIAEAIGLPLQEFKLVSNPLSKKEWKDLDLAIERSGIFDGTAVYAVPGRALEAGELLSRVYLYHLNPSPALVAAAAEAKKLLQAQKESLSLTVARPAPTAASTETKTTPGQDGSSPSLPPPPPPMTTNVALGNVSSISKIDLLLPDFELLHHELIIKESQSFDEIERNLRAQISQDIVISQVGKPAEAGPGAAQKASDSKVLPARSLGPNLRWRLKFNRRAGRVLQKDQTLKDHQIPRVQDGIEFVVQEIDSPDEPVGPETLVVHLQHWSPAQWTLDPKKHEVLTFKDITIFQLKKIISERLGFDAEYLQITKAPLAVVQAKALEALIASSSTSKPMTDDAPNTNLNSESSCPAPSSSSVSESPEDEEKNNLELMQIACLNWTVPDHHSLSGSPLYLVDGNLVYFRDSREKDKYEPDPELRAFHMQSQSNDGHGITIRTDFDDFEEDF